MSRQRIADRSLLPWAVVLAILVAWAPMTASSPAAPRRFPPAAWMLGPIYATGCPVWGQCGHANDMAGEAIADIDGLAANDIPLTVYHFDGQGWSSGACSWALGQPVLTQMRAGSIRAMVHAWGGCNTAGRIRGVREQLGSILGAIYLDEGSTDAFAAAAFATMRSMTADGEVVMKAYQGDGGETDAGLAASGHAAYVGDLAADFDGLRTGIARVFAKRALLPAPFNEFTGYDRRPDSLTEEAYFRRLHWGALQMVMEHDCVWDCDPWGSRYAAYSPALLAAYRYHTWLHAELVPYLHSYDYRMYETGEPVFRDSDPTRYTTRLGEELFVAYVTQPGVGALDVTLPAGEWLNYWNETEVYEGGSTIVYPVPPGREPLFIRNGAIIPMQVSRDYTGHGTAASAGSLTALVYPSGSSSFLYRDRARWVRFTSVLDGAALTLGSSPAPSQSVLYRVGRWSSAPDSVQVDGTTVTINGNGNSPRAVQVDSEEAVNGAAENAWFYDAYAARLIVKVVAVESGRAHESRTPSIDVTPFSLLARSRQAR